MDTAHAARPWLSSTRSRSPCRRSGRQDGRRPRAGELGPLAPDGRDGRRADRPQGRRRRPGLLLVRVPDLERLQPDAQPARRRVPRRSRQAGRASASIPTSRDADVATHATRLRPEVPGRPRPRRGARPQARRDGDARGVRDRRPRAGPLPRPDRRPVRRAAEAEREPDGATSCRTRSPPSSTGERGRRAAHVAGRRLPDPRGHEPPRQRRPTASDVARDPPEELPGVPPPGPGRAVRPRDLRAGPQAGRRHRHGGRGPRDAAVEGRRPASGRSSSTTARSPTHEIATLAAWAEAGAPEGDPPTCPPPPTFPDDWTLGTPDLVLEHRHATSRSRPRATTSTAAS